MTGQYHNQLVLITGGSSGIGLALAKKLSKLGANVWILARRPEQLQIALEEIKHEKVSDSQHFGVIPCDLANAEQLTKTLKDFQQNTGTPDVLINAAGYAYPAKFLDIDPQIFYNQMDVNYFGTVNTIRAFLPEMIKRDSGHIVNVCSLAGYLTMYGFTAYSPTKFAVRGFSDALRSELKFTGVKLSISIPPDTDTPGFETENITKPDITMEVSQAAGLAEPAEVADSILKGMKRKRYLIITGFESNLFYTLSNLAGRLVYPIMDMMVASAAKKSSKQ